MNLNMRTLTVSILSSGLLALGSSVAFADSANNIDNTTSGMSGHGTGCSNHVGGCYQSGQASSFGRYQPSSEPATTNTNMNSSNSTWVDPTPAGSCLDAADATPGHCISGGTNK